MPYTSDELKARRPARRLARLTLQEERRIEQEKNQKPVRSLIITIEWRRSHMWGRNPHASVEVHYMDGTFLRDQKDYTCSGCGYDKESTVIAEIFNTYLKYLLWNCPLERFLNQEEWKKINILPYGVSRSGPWTSDDKTYLTLESRHYNGGVGTSCYPRIAKALGCSFDSIASGKTFDFYEFRSDSGGKND